MARHKSKTIVLCGIVLCVLFCFTEISFAAKVKAPTPLSLGQSIKIGLAQSPRIASARSRVAASEATVGQARSGFYPQVDITESYNRTTNPMWAFGTKLNQEIISSADFDPTRLNDPKAIENFGTTLSATLPVYNRGQTWIGWKQAKLHSQAISYQRDRIRQQVIADIVVRYFGVLLAHERLLVVNQALKTAEAHRKSVGSRFKSGLVVKSDVLRAEVRIAELEQERLQAQSQEEIARAALDAAMGVEIGRAFELVTKMRRHSALGDPLKIWISTALKSRPDLQQMRLQEMMAEQEVKKATAAHLPGIYVSGSYELDSEDFTKTANNYTVGALMRVNLFSGFGLQAKVHEAKAGVRQMRAMVEQLELRVKVETRKAFLEAHSAWQRINVAEAAIAQAEEGLRIVRNRYESGLFTIVNLLDAEVALEQARMHYFQSLHDLEIATARLKLAAGTIDETFH